MTFNLYGLILGIAILAGLQASLWLAKRREIEVKLIEKLFFFVVIGGIIGARIYHVVDKWGEIYSLNPQSAFYVWNGGLGIWGAVIGGTITASIWYLVVNRKRVIPAKAGIYIDGSPIRSGMTGKVSFLQLLDVVFFGLPLGQAIGRWGNFFNNEIVGKNGESLFLYESILNLGLFLALVRISRMKQTGRVGRISGVYLMGYGLIRFLLEPLRPESIVWEIAGLPTAQIFSVLAIISGVFLIWRRRV